MEHPFQRLDREPTFGGRTGVAFGARSSQEFLDIRLEANHWDDFGDGAIGPDGSLIDPGPKHADLFSSEGSLSPGLPPGGGMSISSINPAAMRMIALLVLSPAWMAGPWSSVTLKAPSRISMRYFPFAFRGRGT